MRELVRLRPEAAQIDDPPHVCGGGGIPEVARCDAIPFHERTGAVHGMNQIEGGVAAGQGILESRPLHCVALHHLDAIPPWVERQP